MKSIEIVSKPTDGHLTTIDISYIVPWHQRHRYESTMCATMRIVKLDH